MTLKQAPRRALPRWLQERLTGRRPCTRLALVRTTGAAQREVATIDLRGKTHKVGDLAKWVSSNVKEHGSRQAEEALNVAEGAVGEAFVVHVFSDHDLLTSRSYDESMLESGQVDQFSVTTHSGAVYTLRYWGGACGTEPAQGGS